MRDDNAKFADSLLVCVSKLDLTFFDCARPSILAAHVAAAGRAPFAPTDFGAASGPPALAPRCRLRPTYNVPVEFMLQSLNRRVLSVYMSVNLDLLWPQISDYGGYDGVGLHDLLFARGGSRRRPLASGVFRPPVCLCYGARRLGRERATWLDSANLSDFAAAALTTAGSFMSLRRRGDKHG